MALRRGTAEVGPCRQAGAPWLVVAGEVYVFRFGVCLFFFFFMFFDIFFFPPDLTCGVLRTGALPNS